MSWFPIISFARRCCRCVQNFREKVTKSFSVRELPKKPLFVRRQSFLCFTTRITNNNNNNNNTVVHSRARS